MTVRVLHTSDWHLGVSMEQAPRHEEHRRFLDWIIDRAKARAIDALVVAGDLFHYMQPSASAQKELYSFLARVAADSPIRTVVLVAGNHDSPTRFDAPREVLGALDVHVVGVLPDDDELDRCLVPLRSEEGAIEAVVAAVPYVPEARLGVTTTKAKPSDVAAQYQRAFRSLYVDLRARARAVYGDDVALIATGHLTCVDPGSRSREGDFHTPIHMFSPGTDGLGPDVFEGWDYVALGHIHRHHQIGDAEIWYPGSPVPTDVVESRSPRYVMELDFEGGKLQRSKPVRLPRWREVYELIGFEDEIIELLKGLQWDSELAPYLYVERLVTTPTRAGVDRFQNFVLQHFQEPRPRIVAFRKKLVVDEETRDAPKSEDAVRPLEELQPEEVFTQMYRLKYEQEPTDEILRAFRSLLVPDEHERPVRDAAAVKSAQASLAEEDLR